MQEFQPLINTSILEGLPLIQLVFYLAFIFLLISAGALFTSIGYDFINFFQKNSLLRPYCRQSAQASLGAFFFFAAMLFGLIPLPGGEETALIGSPFFKILIPQAILIPYPLIMIAALICSLGFRVRMPKSMAGSLAAVFTSLLMLVYIFWWQSYGWSDLAPIGAYHDPLNFLSSSYEKFQSSEQKGFYLFSLCTFLFSLALSSAFTMIWLIIKRKWDDFGRDYYNFAMIKSARRTILFVILSILTMVFFLNWQYKADLNSFLEQNFLILIIMGIFSVLSLVFAGLIAKSSSPMRHKVSAVTALVFYAIVCIGFFILVPFMPICFLTS